MTIHRAGFLMIACGAMLLCWVHAWAAFVMPTLGYRPFSLIEGAVILALAATVTRLHRGRGWRMIWIIGVQTLGVTWAALWMVHSRFEWPASFWSMGWVAPFVAQAHGLVEWMAILLVLFWAAVLWIGGIKLALKRPDRLTMASRFDLGTAAFLALLLIRLLMIAKGVAINQGELRDMSFIAFFMFGLLAMGMAGRGDPGKKDYVTTYRGAGAILGFTFLVLLLGGGLLVLFLPSFMRAAELGHDVLKAAAKPVVPVLIGMLRFVLVRGCHMAPEKSRSSGGDQTDPLLLTEAGKGTGLLHDILKWGALGLGCVILLSIIGFISYYLIRWLLSRKEAGPERSSLWERLMRWMSTLSDVIRAFFGDMTRKRGKQGPVVSLYTRLLRWGAGCGLPHMPVETPLEYGKRLSYQFPGLTSDITLIVERFSQSVYGGVSHDKNELDRLRLAWQRLRSPRHWPARFKTWFLSPGA